MRKNWMFLVVLLIIPFALASCGEQSNNLADGEFKPCIVSGVGGFNDNSFGQSGLKGMEKITGELGIEFGRFEVSYSTQITPQIQASVDQSCDLVIAMSYEMKDAIEDIAKQNPTVNFVVIDSNTEEELPNVKQVFFDVSQPSFLAGYAAAAVSKTGVVATYGGKKNGPLLLFLNGFYDGVDYYNTLKGTSVKVLGWNREQQDGDFAGGYSHQEEGKVLAQFFIDSGADVIFPVAGSTGLGTLNYVKNHNLTEADAPKASVVWVDSDGAAGMPEYSDIILTSVEKGIPKSVEDVVRLAYQGNFDNSTYTGAFSNEGVLISPWHEFASRIPLTLDDEVNKIKSEKWPST
jgi:basic membrane protein A